MRFKNQYTPYMIFAFGALAFVLLVLLTGCGDTNVTTPTQACCADTCEHIHTCDGNTGCTDPCADPQPSGKKLKICFNGETIKVLKTDWPTYKAQGATKGACPKGDDDDDDSDSDSDNDKCKVTICHIPPGNPSNLHTITVGCPAWPAHEAHGDYLGACNQ
jgi:hypothetical protein